MARPKTIEVSALNISMHSPHSAQGYVDLFARAKQRKRVFMQGEIHALMLGSLLDTENSVNANELVGEVFRFVKVDANAPWFNTETNDEASEDDKAAVSIPPNLYAHMQRLQFIFFPREHQLWYISNDGKVRMGPKRLESFLQRLLDDASASMQGLPVEVTTLPDKAALEKMFKLHRLERIVMQFKRPNPDDGADIAAKIMERMEAQNIARLNEELIATKGHSITPDAQTLAEADVAAKNGHVEVFGKTGEGVPVKASTTNIPLRVSLKIDSDVETPLAAVRRARFGH